MKLQALVELAAAKCPSKPERLAQDVRLRSGLRKSLTLRQIIRLKRRIFVTDQRDSNPKGPEREAASSGRACGSEVSKQAERACAGRQTVKRSEEIPDSPPDNTPEKAYFCYRSKGFEPNVRYAHSYVYDYAVRFTMRIASSSSGKRAKGPEREAASSGRA